jgi:antitoxin component YwqK of YwqJK toxin-antitoxin module
MTDINQYNEKNQRHGYWEHYGINGKVYSKGNYHNGERVGYWEDYYSNGNILYKGNYHNQTRIGYWEFYWANGELELQIFYS